MRPELWQKAFLLGAGAGMVLVTLTGILLPVAHGRVYLDFTVFWAAAISPVAQAYDLAAITAVQADWFNLTGPRPFAYPPTTLLFMRPFGELAFLPALLLWSAMGFAAFVHVGRRLAGFTATALALLSPSVVAALVSGQTSLFVGALTIGGLIASTPLATGVLLGTAAVLKPQMFLLLPLALMASRQWRALLYSGLTSGALAGLTVVLWGFELWFDWLSMVQDFPRLLGEIGIHTHGVTINAFAIRHGLPDWTFLLGLPLAIATVWFVFRRSECPIDRLVALICGAALSSPYMLHYDLAPLAIGASALLLDKRKSFWDWLGATLSLTYVLAGLGIIVLALARICSMVRRPSAWAGGLSPAQS